MSNRNGPLDRVFRSVVTRAVGSIDAEELMEQVDIDQILQNLDLDALLDRIDWNAVLARVDPDLILDRVDPNALLDRVDPNALLDRVDPDRLLDRVDPDRLVARVDPAVLLDRVDLDTVLARVDLDALLATVDLTALVEQIDLDAVLARVDLNALVARVDLDAAVAGLDVEAVAGRLDLDRLLARVDVNALVSRVDVAELVARAGVDQIVAEATSGLAHRTLQVAQRTVAGADRLPLRVADRIFRREPLPREARDERAGPLARALAFLLDGAVVSLLFSGGVLVSRLLVELFTGGTLTLERTAGWWWVVGYALWWWLYFWLPVALTGRTVGKAVLGLTVVRSDGAPVGAGRAAVRALVLPISLIAGIGMIPALVTPKARALHDFAAGTREVTDPPRGTMRTWA